MKAPLTASSQSQPFAVVRRNSHSRYQYRKVLDGRKQPICGLGKRSKNFHPDCDGSRRRQKKKSGGCRRRVEHSFSDTR
jgi:hypothetical protein